MARPRPRACVLRGTDRCFASEASSRALVRLSELSPAVTKRSGTQERRFRNTAIYERDDYAWASPSVVMIARAGYICAVAKSIVSRRLQIRTQTLSLPRIIEPAFKPPVYSTDAVAVCDRVAPPQGSEINVQMSRHRFYLCALLAAGSLLGVLSRRVVAQQSDTSAPVIVQPGAPGQPTRTLPSNTTGALPPSSPKDVEFMQGMIVHHAQAVEMTALIESHTTNKNLRLLGARISHSQAEEIKFMKHWLEAKGEPTSMPMQDMSG